MALRHATARSQIEAMEQRILLSMPTLWTTDGPGGGGALYGAVIAPNGQDLWVSSDMSGIYHSRDLGQSWQMINFHTSTGGVNGGSLTQVRFTSDPNTVYVANTNLNVGKSTDGGATWAALSGWSAGTAYWIGTDLSTTTRILVSDGSNLYLSTDGGTSFSTAYTSSDLYVAGAFFDGSNVYVGTNEGLLISSNGGATFALAAQQPGQAIMSFAGAKQGSTVRLLALTTSDAPTPDSDPEFLTYGGAYRLDVGGSWVDVSSGIAAVPGSKDMHYVSMAQNNINIVYTAGGEPADDCPQVYKSTDGGTNWADVFYALPTDVTPNVPNANTATGYEGYNGDVGWWWGGFASGFAVCATDPNKAIIAQNFTHITTDGGISWHQTYENAADSNPAGANTPQHKAYRGVGLTETSVHYIEWMSPTNIMASYTDIDGWRSTDGGVSWSHPNYNGVVQNTLYKTIYSGGKLYGATSNVHDMYVSTHLTDASCNPSWQYGAVVVSADQGATWSSIHSFGVPVIWIQTDPNNANRMYAMTVDGVGANGGIWVTNNLNLGAASTWSHLSSPARTQGHPYNLQVLNDGTLVATYSGRRTSVFTDSSGVFISTDGGLNWTDRSAANMHWYTKEITIDPTDPTQNTWYVGVFNGWGGTGNDLGDLYRTTNRGVTWTKMNLPSVVGADSMSIQSATINPATKEMYVTTEGYGMLYAPDVTVAGFSAANFSDVASFPFGTTERVFINPYNSQDVWVASFGGGIVRGGVAPSALTATAISSSQINLTWADNSTNETGFAIDRATDSGFTLNLVTTTVGMNATSASITGLSSSTPYYFRIRATNGANKSANSNSASATTLSGTNQAPTDIALSPSSVPEKQPVGTTVGTLSTTDPDTGNTFTYSLVSGSGSTDNTSFTISGSTLQTAAIFDFAAKSSYSIRVRTTDQGGLWFEKVLTVTVTKANQTPTDIALSNSSVAENQPLGTAVGTLSTTDPDAGNTFTYSLVSGTGSTDNASFTISGSTLQTAAIFNYEARNSYSIRIRTTDQGGLWFEKTFTISVTNVNEAPTDIALSNSSIAENQPSGTAVGTLSSTDPDAGNTFTYSLVAGTGSTDNASFTISGSTLQTAASFNFEAKSSYSIRLRSTDQGGLWFEKVFTIIVTNVNETPTDIALSNSNIAENQPPATAVGTLSTTDPDAGNTFTYSLVSGTGSTDNASFTISGNQLQTAASFNFEAKNSYSVRIRSTDQGGLWFEKALTINVTNVNEAPTDTTLSPSSVPENQPIGTTVGTFSTLDPDIGDTFTYMLVSGTGGDDNASFTISGNTLQTAAVFNYAAKNSYSIRVRTIDAGGLFLGKVFTITITQVDRTPTDIALSNSSIAENQPLATAVGTLSSTDPDAGNTFTYSLVSGAGSADNASFAISGSTLQTAAIFNYEARNSYSIRIRTTDQGGLWFEKAFTITVTNVNETPTDIALSNSSIAENQPSSTAVGTLSSTDPDTGNTFAYTLVSGSGSTDNASFTISGNQLLTVAPFNFEAKSSYSIRIRTTDQGGLWFEKVFTIIVTNVNEAPTDIALSNSSIAENQPSGTAVGTLSSTDPDAGNTFIYSLVAGTGSTDNASFTISGSTLQTAASFNFETKSSYSIRLRSTDQDGLWFEKTFTISVMNAAELAPTITGISTDTGISSTDGITSDKTLVISGTSEPGMSISLYRDGVLAGTTSADGSGNWSYDYTGINLADGSYSFTATASDTLGNTTAASSPYAVKVDTTAPTVTAVYVRGSTWNTNYLSFLATNLSGSSSTYGFAIPVGSGSSQLQTLPWRNLNQISIRFSEDVSIAQAQFAIVGSVGSYSISGFSYNAADHVATWSLSAAIGPDKLYVALPGTGTAPVQDAAGNMLDGEWNNPSSYSQVGSTSSFPSGNGVAGGDFAFRFDVLPGDSTGGSLGKVNVADVAQTKSRSSLPVTLSTYRSDFDGNNLVNVADVAYVKSKSSIYSLPVNPPVLPAFSLLSISGSLLLSSVDPLRGVK